MAYDVALRSVMWWDAFLSLLVAVLAIVALPAVMLSDLPRSAVVGVGIAAILAAMVLAACGIVTAVLIALRLRLGDDRLPARLRLPLPAWMRPTLQDGGFEAAFGGTSTTESRRGGGTSTTESRRGGGTSTTGLRQRGGKRPGRG